MHFQIDPDNGVPIYEQIVRQVKYAVAEGVVVPGELIPSVREMSRQLAVNPNTVQRAVQSLQAEGILESLRGRGLAVCAGARRQCVSDRQNLLKERLEGLVGEAVQSGLDPGRLTEMFERALAHSLAKRE